MRFFSALMIVVLLVLSAKTGNAANKWAETKIGIRQLGVCSPVVVQRGTKTQIKVHSNYTLDRTYATFCDPPGIELTFAETKPIAAPWYPGMASVGTPFRFDVTVPANQRPGVYDIRVATRKAVSSVSNLLVTDYPVVLETTKTNDSRKTAQTVTIPVAIAGICNPSADVDYYRFSGKAGQELTIQCYAQQVTRTIVRTMSAIAIFQMDTLLTLYGPRGQIIARNDNFIGGDSLIACRLPETADYVLEIRDTRYIGNKKYVYAIEIHDRPSVYTTFPTTVQQGTTTKLELIGHALGGTKTVAFAAAANEKLGPKIVRFDTARGETNPVTVTISPHRQVVVTGTHSSIATAIPVTLPVGVNGRFPQPEQMHFFSFEASKDHYYHFEVTSHRQNLPLDSIIEIYDAQGKSIADQDDGWKTNDSNYYFHAPADGRYYCSLRDARDKGSRRHCYNLAIEPTGEDFELYGEYYYAQLGPGTRTIWFVKINRVAGFTGPVEMQVEGLPPGVSYTPLTIPANMTECGLILSAAPDAKINATLVRIRGKAMARGVDGQKREIVHYGHVTCEMEGSGGGNARWPIHSQLVGVTEPADLLRVEASPAEITLKPNEEATINVRIVRNKEFKYQVTLTTMFKLYNRMYGRQLPPGVSISPKSVLQLKGDLLQGKIILKANAKAQPVARLPIAAMAEIPLGSPVITAKYASNPVYLTVLTPKKKAPHQNLWANSGEEPFISTWSGQR